MISTEHVLVGSYDFQLVALSVLISVVACYAALDRKLRRCRHR